MKTKQKAEEGQSRLDRTLAAIPRLMSSRVSVFIFLFLFFYLVVYALVCILIPPLNRYMPDANMQVVLGNYTNVLSALGASIAAGSGVAIHTKVKALHKRHDDLDQTIGSLHKKIDALQKNLDKLEKTK